jgi:hypothetical protein
MGKNVQSVLLVFIALCCNASLLQGQYESSSFTLTGIGATTPFARDYQSLSINPANLDMATGYDRKTTLGLFDFTASLYTELLSKLQLMWASKYRPGLGFTCKQASRMVATTAAACPPAFISQWVKVHMKWALPHVMCSPISTTTTQRFRWL